MHRTGAKLSSRLLHMLETGVDNSEDGDDDNNNNDNNDNNNVNDSDSDGDGSNYNNNEEEDRDEGVGMGADVGHETTEMEVNEDLWAAYPRPTLSVAVHPTCPCLIGDHLVSTYGTTDLIRLLTQFLKPLAHKGSAKPAVFLSNKFDVWHKLTLQHQPIPFAQHEPLQRDVVRTRPPSTDQQGRPIPGVFDTALFLHQRDAVGLACYRACRVRAIFTLPPRLQDIYAGRLVYIELFTHCKTDTSTHLMQTLSHDVKDGQRRGKVIPIEDLVMACHLAP
ncbi:hypothetical protein BDV93DRAFT_515438 [Ceratobasidium sp. AG-I]|nr:hypothetical protein BDV93DRAFT_515438 [Ceratobasidium sp. AG-I]